MELSDWFKGFEKGISCLDPEQRASFFSECGKNCVKCGTLQIYQKLYEKANGNLDTFFLEANELPILWNVLVCFISRVTFPHLCFVSAPNKVSSTSCVHCGKARHFG